MVHLLFNINNVELNLKNRSYLRKKGDPIKENVNSKRNVCIFVG